MSEGQDKTGRKASQTPEQKAEDDNGDDDRSDVDHGDDKSDQGELLSIFCAQQYATDCPKHTRIQILVTLLKLRLGCLL